MRGFNAMALPFAIRLSWSAGSVNYILHTLPFETKPQYLGLN
jgi:hypothetical protein